MSRVRRLTGPPPEHPLGAVFPRPLADYAPPGSEDVEAEAERIAAGDIALLDDQQFGSYKWSIWRRRLPDEIAREPEGGELEHVATKLGSIDEEWARATLGGGTFEFRGYYDPGDGRGRRLARKPIITIAGPRKNFNAPPPAPPAAPPTAGQAPGVMSDSERRLLRFLKRRDDKLEALVSALVQRANTPPPAPIAPATPTLKDLAETMMMLDKMRSATPAHPETAVVETMLKMVDKGIALGEGREGGGPPEQSNGLASAIVAAAPVVDKMLTAMMMRGRRPAGPPHVAHVPPPPAGTPTGSHAQVVGADAPEAPINEPAISPRLVVAVQSLARAVARGDDPVAFADSLERVLDDQELGLLRLGDPAQVLADVRTIGAAEYPILNTAPAEAFLAAVLAELRNPSDDAELEAGDTAE